MKENAAMNRLMAGFARVNITPMMGIGIMGYYQERIADGVLDDLELNVLALACGEKRAVVISGDLIVIENDVAEDYLAYISEVTGLQRDAILFHATHTHTGPFLRKDTGETLKDEYFRMVRHKIADAVCFALKDLKPAKMGWAVGQAPNVAFIRRYRMKDGTVRTNPGVNNPNILEPVGKVDDRVGVVRFDREGADSIVLVNFGNHPDTVGGCKISCDWPGFLRRTVEKTLDNVKCIFMNGMQGDVNHVNVWPTGGYLNDTVIDFDDVSRGYGHARFVGRVVAGGVLQVFDKVKNTDVDSLEFLRRVVKIPSNMPEPKEIAEARYLYEMHLAGRDDELPFTGMMLTTKIAEAERKLKLEHGPEYFEMEFSGLSVGEVALIGIPGEPFNGVGVELKRSDAFGLVIPACCVNGNLGYFPMKDSYDEGGYEAGTSIFRAGVAELIIDEGRALLSDLKSSGR